MRATTMQTGADRAVNADVGPAPGGDSAYPDLAWAIARPRKALPGQGPTTGRRLASLATRASRFDASRMTAPPTSAPHARPKPPPLRSALRLDSDHEVVL